jgi:uncharacterized protein YtpQ (UPF0354 family)
MNPIHRMQRTGFAEVRSRVLPMLKPLDMLIAVHEHNLPMLIYQPFPAHLMITYVVDEGGRISYINEQHLEAWRVPVDQLHAQALGNLRQRTNPADATNIGEGVRRMVLFHRQDGYDATRVLLNELLEAWQAMLPGQMVIGIPTRDSLIVFSDSDRALLTRLARQVQMDAAHHAAGLTNRLLTFADGEMQEYRLQ